MNSKHLTVGSICPPLKTGLLRVYSIRFGPYPHRVILVANAKGIPLDIVNVNPEEKPSWFLEKNPNGKLPVLEAPNGLLSESFLISQYLDEIGPGRALTSGDPYLRGLDKIWIGKIDKVGGALSKLWDSNREDLTERLVELFGSLIPFEEELHRRGSVYFGGDSEPGMMDYMLWPWFERLPLLKLSFPNLYDFEAQEAGSPCLTRWQTEMREDPVVRMTYLPPETHWKFFEGHPNEEFDMLADKSG